MPSVTIYTGDLCGFCVRAKQLLDAKGVSYLEINVSADPDQRAQMMQKAHGARTVPQIFIDDLHIGGCDDLYALDRANKLDPLLAA